VSAERQRKRFSDFIAMEWRRLVSFVRTRLDDSEEWDAEDIVQEVLTDIYERADVAAPIVDLASYVSRALRNRIVDAYRSKKRTVPLESDGLPPMGESLLDVLEDTRFEAATQAEKSALRDELFSAIDALPDEQRAVLVATELEGWKFSELSEKLDIPLGTLLARKHRAVRKLRAALAHHDARRPETAPGQRAALAHNGNQGGTL
jgi:RNA polymerase sigma factor (sigma-70 family)